MEEGGKMNRIHAQEARKSKTAQPQVGGVVRQTSPDLGLDPPELAGILPGGPAAAAAGQPVLLYFCPGAGAAKRRQRQLDRPGADQRLHQPDFSGYPGAGAGTADPAGGRFPPIRGRDQRYQKAETGRAAAGAFPEAQLQRFCFPGGPLLPPQRGRHLFRRLF